MGYWGEEGERLLGVSSNGYSRKAKHFVTGTFALCPSHLMKQAEWGVTRCIQQFGNSSSARITLLTFQLCKLTKRIEGRRPCIQQPQ